MTATAVHIPRRHHLSPPGDIHPQQKSSLGLAALAIGVVFGDIGTSPIYAFKAAFSPEYGLQPSPGTILGLVSLIVWTLTITVSIKYVAFIMRADNRGEGGILALLALLRDSRALVALGLFGAALLYGDGIITPAISVLSAIEGLGVASPELTRFTVPVSVAILFVLFAVQRLGTQKVGGVFGPIMIVWFVSISLLGASGIARDPRVLLALNPVHGLRFLVEHGFHGFTVLGAVVLAVTGAEALYADMGFFGRRPIRLAWFGLVFPALLLNYAGQGALVMSTPSAIGNPFYLLVPQPLLYPMIALTTVATVIASQALISGAFALTNQTIQLGYSPRLEIIHTAPESAQIFVPAVNRTLMIGCLILVVTFRSSDALGAAYGIAVTGTMAITTVLFYQIARRRWMWSALRAGSLAGFFLTIDLAFFAANALKIAHGGWVPLAFGIAIWTLMTTWAWGRKCLLALRREGSVPLDTFLPELEKTNITRVPGTGIFLTSHPDGVPRALRRMAETLHVLPSDVVLLSVDNQERPSVPMAERVSVVQCPHRFVCVTAHYGFLEQPDLSVVLRTCGTFGINLNLDQVTYFLNGERLTLIPTRNPFLNWRKRLFRALARNSRSAPDFFNLPPDQVVEVGLEARL